MSERFSRLFSLPENLGQYGCPVLISAGALLKDNNTGKLLVQLKLRNISEQVVKSVKIKINAYDTAGCELKGVEAFSYLDLAAGRDKEFGNRTPIILSDKTTRSFSAEILSVAFMDGTAYIPSIHIAADTLDSETLETVQLLDKERRERKEKQLAIQKEQYRRIRRVSPIPLLINACAVLLSSILVFWQNYPDSEFILLVMRSRYLRWLLSFIVPCLCMISCRKIKCRTFLIKFATVIATVFLTIQIVAVCIYPFDYRYYGSRIFVFACNNVAGSSLIDSLDSLRYYMWSELDVYDIGWFCFRLLRTLTDALFLLKNVFAAVILFKQTKKAKN